VQGGSLMKKVVIVGAGENGCVVKDILDAKPGYCFAGFLDDRKKGKEVIGRIADYHFYLNDYHFFVSMGNNESRRCMFQLLAVEGARFVNAIHPSSVVAKTAELGQNVMIGPLSAIIVGTKIGNNTLVNTACIIEHHNTIGSHCHLTPRVVTGGGVEIGDGAFIGMNSVIRDHITLGSNVFVGMGTVVHKPLPDGARMVGRRITLKK
jgi:acetyltransferase EpsM